jgi:hypothetical protein
MEGVFMLVLLCITMLIGSFIAGLLPMALSLSEVIFFQNFYISYNQKF